MEHLPNDHKDHANEHKNSDQPCNETASWFEFIGRSMETGITT